jgi:hypothetical protein
MTTPAGSSRPTVVTPGVSLLAGGLVASVVVEPSLPSGLYSRDQADIAASAGRMEAFFREVTKADAMPPQDLALWRAHGMELLGPPLSVE